MYRIYTIDITKFLCVSKCLCILFLLCFSVHFNPKIISFLFFFEILFWRLYRPIWEKIGFLVMSKLCLFIVVILFICAWFTKFKYFTLLFCRLNKLNKIYKKERTLQNLTSLIYVCSVIIIVDDKCKICLNLLHSMVSYVCIWFIKCLKNNRLMFYHFESNIII